MADTQRGRPTLYKGIRMRSRLEAGFAKWMDTHNLDGWEYEPIVFADEAGQYLPDFLVPKLSVLELPSTDGGLYVEVKPDVDSGRGIIGRAAEVIRNTNGGRLVLATPEAVCLVCKPGGPAPAFLLPMVWVWHPYGGKERWRPALAPEMDGGPWAGEWWKS